MHPGHRVCFPCIILGALFLLGCGSASPDTQNAVAPAANFALTPASPTMGQTVIFTDTSTGNPTSWSWTFGDSSTSTSQNPTHTYTTAGTYTVTLTATNGAGSSSPVSHVVTVSAATSLTLSSSVGTDGGMLPIDYTGDGSGASPALMWSGAPSGTKGFALVMTTPSGPGDAVPIKYNWVLYSIPATTTSLARNATGVGTGGMNTHGRMVYDPPMSQGPGAKVYTFTLYALSALPTLPSDPTQVTGDVLTAALSSITLGSASLNLSYTRSAPVAGFTSSVNGSTVTFTSACGLSTTSWSWSFGDGTTSTDKNPSHTYATTGTYTVSLTATNDIGSNTTSKSVTASSTGSNTTSFTYVSAAKGYYDKLYSGHAITFTDTSTGTPTSWLWAFTNTSTGVTETSTAQNPVHIFTVPAINAPDHTITFTVKLTSTSAAGSSSSSQSLVVHQPLFNIYQDISTQAQGTTVSFSGFAMMTGNFCAQTFFPPGKIADYTGFQYLRDNDPSNMGHNTDFVTKSACNVVSILTDAQIAQLVALATAQQSDFNQNGYKRFTLMKAFRRLMDKNLPTGTTGLSLDAIKAYSKSLYLIDGQVSYDRAVLYANILNQMATTTNPNNASQTQLAYLDAMKGFGCDSWPNVTLEMVKAKMQGLTSSQAVLVMTYAGDIFSWYAGSVDADVYFCPERHGTYYGGLYMKDAPAIGHDGYSISETLTAEAGNVLLGVGSNGRSEIGQAPYYITQSQADAMAALWGTTEQANLTSIVSTRTQIATLLRSLRTTADRDGAIKAQVLALLGTYDELDGANNYALATGFTNIHNALLSDTQKTALQALRTSILTGTYADGTAFDFTNCKTNYLYSAPVTGSDIASYVSDTATASLFQ